MKIIVTIIPTYLEIENYKIRLIHVFILFSTFHPLQRHCQATVNIFLQTELS